MIDGFGGKFFLMGSGYNLVFTLCLTDVPPQIFVQAVQMFLADLPGFNDIGHPGAVMQSCPAEGKVMRKGMVQFPLDVTNTFQGKHCLPYLIVVPVEEPVNRSLVGIFRQKGTHVGRPKWCMHYPQQSVFAANLKGQGKLQLIGSLIDGKCSSPTRRSAYRIQPIGVPVNGDGSFRQTKLPVRFPGNLHMPVERIIFTAKCILHESASPL